MKKYQKIFFIDLFCKEGYAFIQGVFMKLFLLLLLGMTTVVHAETLQNLTQNNASPEEIIQKLNVQQVVYTPDIEAKEPIQVGTVISLIRRGSDTPFYDFTIALSDGRVITVSDANHLALKPNDMIILSENQGFLRIKSKVSK